MSKPKPKHTRSAPPSLNAIYRQQLLLRDAVKALTETLTETQARCEKLQFDRGVLIEKLRQYRGVVLRGPLPTPTERPKPSERDEDLAAVQSIIDQLRSFYKPDTRLEWWVNGAVLAFNAIMDLKLPAPDPMAGMRP